MADLAVRPARQARTRASWERILDGGVAILEEHGYDGLTIAALCERVGVTAPTIYRRAPNKDALLVAIYEHGSARLRAGDRVSDATSLREAVEVFTSNFLVEAPLVRAMVHRAATDPEVFRRGSEQSIDLARQFRAAVGGDERASDACFRVVYAAVVQRAVYGPQFESDVVLSDDEFVQMLGDVAERYMLKETP